jgi:hypothetical protein
LRIFSSASGGLIENKNAAICAASGVGIVRMVRAAYQLLRDKSHSATHMLHLLKGKKLLIPRVPKCLNTLKTSR